VVILYQAVHSLGEASDHVLTRKINDEKLEEMEDKEFQDQQSWRIWFRSMEVKLKVVVEKVKTSNNQILYQAVHFLFVHWPH
jgi:hypothetical protein